MKTLSIFIITLLLVPTFLLAQNPLQAGDDFIIGGNGSGRTDYNLLEIGLRGHVNVIMKDLVSQVNNVIIYIGPCSDGGAPAGYESKEARFSAVLYILESLGFKVVRLPHRTFSEKGSGYRGVYGYVAMSKSFNIDIELDGLSSIDNLDKPYYMGFAGSMTVGRDENLKISGGSEYGQMAYGQMKFFDHKLYLYRSQNSLVRLTPIIAVGMKNFRRTSIDADANPFVSLGLCLSAGYESFDINLSWFGYGNNLYRGENRKLFDPHLNQNRFEIDGRLELNDKSAVVGDIIYDRKLTKEIPYWNVGVEKLLLKKWVYTTPIKTYLVLKVGQQAFDLDELKHKPVLHGNLVFRF